MSVVVNEKVLAELVKKETDEFTANFGFNASHHGELAKALSDLAATERQNKVQAAAGEIRKLLAACTGTQEALVMSIREHRRAEVSEVKRLRAIDKAKQYGLETMNFLPLLSLIRDDGKHAVPSDWEPVKVPAAEG